MPSITLAFHTPTSTLATFDNFTDALAFADTLDTFQGVAVTLPQGGEMNSHSFQVWARNMIRRGVVK